MFNQNLTNENEENITERQAIINNLDCAFTIISDIEKDSPFVFREQILSCSSVKSSDM
ncbi:13848_t:CDS:2, partial [Racocetra persica]